MNSHNFYVLPKDMKVCIVDQGDIFGGAERFTLDIIRYTSKSKVDFHLIHDEAADPAYLREIEDISFMKRDAISMASISPQHLISYPRAFFASNQLKSRLKKIRPDIVQSNTVRTHCLASFAVKGLGIPLVWVLHDFTFPEKFLLRYVDVPVRIVCVSEAVKSYYQAMLPKEVHDKFVVVPNGVHPDKIKNAEAYTMVRDIDGEEFTFEKHRRYIGLIGRIDSWKGQDIFLRTVDILHKEYPQHQDVTYLVIGGVTATSAERIAYYDELRQFQKEKHLTDVHFLGAQDAAKILHNLDVLIHASTDAEPFGRTIIEAFSAGVPVIASRLGAPEEIIEYGSSGLLFEARNPQDLAQKISLLLEDNHLSETLKMNGKKVVRARYHIEKVVEQFYALWCSIQKRS